ncbi:MAG: DUF554 domain-containing protein [Candidatus Faecalibacterium intestinavium]|uniref:DUF554 domain-containing protein n=1 Tax=Candidatus Faecalibacterium intestinavium TaxID=2838580 RepID=A0A9E2NQ97_9FIRM|nr:DUF554 domain-containing protein [Candidatus Faecalibacterium intestinavium]
MTGTLVNAGMIAAGSCVGLILKKGLRPHLEQAIHQATGLAVIMIGLNGALTNMLSSDPATGSVSSSGELMLVFSMILGAIVGESLGIEEHLNRLGDLVEDKLHLSGFAQSFVNGALIYCVGAMAIVGAINDGLLGDPSTLITKGVLDGVTSIVLAASMGPGVLFSAIPVILYQGGLTLFAGLLEPVLQGELLRQICAAGFVLVGCIGVNFMSDKFHIKVANFLPALLVPALWAGVKALLALAGMPL